MIVVELKEQSVPIKRAADERNKTTEVPAERILEVGSSVQHGKVEFLFKCS